MKFKLFIVLLMTVSSILPVMAQDAVTTNTVAFNGFSFSYDSTIAANVNISQYAGDPSDVPFTPEPRHTQFVLYNTFPVPEGIMDTFGAIRVYNIADVMGNEARESQIIQMQSLLDQRPDLASYMTMDSTILNALPFLPVFPAAQVIRARAQYVETDAVMGISYITVYRQDIGPFIASEFMYTFQGMSKDGMYYISAMFPVEPSMFPAEYPVVDLTTFDMVAYANDSIAQLNAAVPEDVTPSLTSVDAVFASFAFAQ